VGNKIVILSVVLPAYNGEKYIADMLSDVYEQSFNNYELIVINDGSKDNTLDICNDFADKNSHIRLFSQDNQGISNTRNRGLSLANGKYLIFLDQDDRISHEMFGELVEKMENEQSDMLISSKEYYITNKSGQIEKKSYPFDHYAYEEDSNINDLIFNIERKNELSTIWNCIYKLQIIRNNDIQFDSVLKMGGEDGLFNSIYASKCKKINTIPNSYYYYQLRDGFSTISKYNRNCLDDYMYSENIINNIMKYRMPKDKLEKYMAYYSIRAIKTIYKHYNSHAQLDSYKKKSLIIKLYNDDKLNYYMKKDYKIIKTNSYKYDIYIRILVYLFRRKNYGLLLKIIEII